MSILLLAECWPYRHSVSTWDNSQGRLLAQAAGVSIQQLRTICDCQYVLERFVLSAKKNVKYELELQNQLRKIIESSNHDIILLVGLRMPKLVLLHNVELFELHFVIQKKIAVIPNPLAEYWWKEQSNVRKCTDYMTKLFKKYAS